MKTSEDYYSALRSAREIAANITIAANAKMAEIGMNKTVEVFPYR